MIDKTPISQQVRDVCAQHFDAKAHRCNACPLMSACNSGPTGNLTFERLEEWRLRLNAAAANHITDN